MSPRKTPHRKQSPSKGAAAKSVATSSARRASIFRNGANQAVRLPQELRFPAEVREVRIRKQGDSLVLSPIRPDWASFFAMKVDVPDDFLADRGDSPPQEREPL